MARLLLLTFLLAVLVPPAVAVAEEPAVKPSDVMDSKKLKLLRKEVQKQLEARKIPFRLEIMDFMVWVGDGQVVPLGLTDLARACDAVPKREWSAMVTVRIDAVTAQVDEPEAADPEPEAAAPPESEPAAPPEPVELEEGSAEE